jgi:hypothetical protein
MTTLPFTLWQARAELIRRATIPTREHVRYWREQGLDHASVAGFAGSLSVLPIGTFEPSRFDFGGPGDPLGAIVEALDEDGETVLDLVAWPIAEPGCVLTMFGRAPVLGLWAAMNPATYVFDRPLIVHRTPLDWLKSGCDGCAVVMPRSAARLFNELTGRIAGQDASHRNDLFRLARSVADPARFLAPQRSAA